MSSHGHESSQADAAVPRFQRASGEGRPNVQELQRACLVLNTSEYCHETAAQLEERLIEKIHADLKKRVSLEAEKQLFLSTVSAALLAILNELEQSVEPSFAAMSRSPWRDAEFVSSESAYLGDVVRTIQATIAVARDSVEHKKYIRTICDKVVGVILAKFTQTIVRCRPISQTGAEQVSRSCAGRLTRLTVDRSDPAGFARAESVLDEAAARSGRQCASTDVLLAIREQERRESRHPDEGRHDARRACRRVCQALPHPDPLPLLFRLSKSPGSQGAFSLLLLGLAVRFC